jgi:uncharacterized coiled-coil DUF342 family protein
MTNRLEPACHTLAEQITTLRENIEVAERLAKDNAFSCVVDKLEYERRIRALVEENNSYRAKLATLGEQLKAAEEALKKAYEKD